MPYPNLWAAERHQSNRLFMSFQSELQIGIYGTPAQLRGLRRYAPHKTSRYSRFQDHTDHPGQSDHPVDGFFITRDHVQQGLRGFTAIAFLVAHRKKWARRQIAGQRADRAALQRGTDDQP